MASFKAKFPVLQELLAKKHRGWGAFGPPPQRFTEIAATGAVLTLARKRCFATFAGVGGVGATPSWHFQTKRRRASRKRPADCSRRVLAIGGIIFGPRSIFDPVMAGQRSNFRKFHDFLTSRVDGIKIIYRNGMKPSPACSPFNSA